MWQVDVDKEVAVMAGICNRAFDFEEWKALAENNPKAFEFVRQKMIDSLIADAGESERLKRLQWRIDVERERSKTPMSACVRISNMMFNSLYGDTGLSNALTGNYQKKDSGEVVSLAGRRQEKLD